MYYNRTLSPSFSSLIENKGPLRWLFDYVKTNPDLDFLIGKNDKKEWISIYRGLTRFLRIHLPRPKGSIVIDAADKYKKMLPTLYGKKSTIDNFQDDIEKLLDKIRNSREFDKYYNSRKEGYFQNIFSRRYGICGEANDDFVIIDKEVVIGYADNPERNTLLGPIHDKYKDSQKAVSRLDSKRYGKDLDKKPIGNELDFLALNRAGDILLIEFKHGKNTSGIYLSPLQVGLYYDLFSMLQMRQRKDLEAAIYEMLAQKQEIGLINPKWNRPLVIRDIIPVLIISEYNSKSSGKTKYAEILDFVRKKHGPTFLQDIKTYNYSAEAGLTNW